MAALKFLHLAVLLLASSAYSSPAVPSSGFMERMAAVGIDLNSCACRQLSSTDCEIAINRLFLPEKDCGKTEHLCCSITKDLPSENSSNKAEQTASEPEQPQVVQPTTMKPVVRIKEVISTNGAKTPIKAPRPTKRGPAKKCRCKTRDKCPDAYTDYSFGFYCTYDKVRCCEPIEIMNKTTEGFLGYPPTVAYEINDSTGGKVVTDETENRTKCVCVEASRCIVSTSTTSTTENFRNPCPNDLVECCGSLSDSQDKDPENQFEVAEDVEDLDPNFIAHRSDEGLKPGNFVEVNPIGLPVNKISEIDQPIDLVTSTLPPPSLPDQYHYPPSTQYYQSVPHVQYAQQQSIPYRTWTDKFGNKYLVDQNGRASLIVSGRSNSKSFFSALSDLFG